MPVKSLTTAEFAAQKRAGWKALDTNYDLSYKSHWTMWHVIREFYQNALDEHDEAKVEAIPTITRATKGLAIRDQGRGLGAEALLLRETKSSAGDLRGRFGEGLKLACIVALREGYLLEIKSPSYRIRPILRDYEMVGKSFQIVSFMWKAEAATTVGTEIVLVGYTGPDYKERFFQFLSGPNAYKAATATYGRFLRTFHILTKPTNSLYVGDIYVRPISQTNPSPYSYSLWDVKLNPDRDAEVNSSQVQRGVSWIWIWASQHLIEDLLRRIKDRSGYEAKEMLWDYVQLMNETKNSPAPLIIWAAAWKKVFGSGAVIRTTDDWAKYAQSFGYHPVDLPNGLAGYLYNVIPTDEKTVKERTGGKRLWLKPLQDSQLSQSAVSLINEARQITRAIEVQADLPAKVQVMAAVFDKDPQSGSIFQGLWDEPTVYLSKTILYDYKDMLKTLLHELGHWFSRAGDLTAEHANGIASVALLALEVERARLAGGVRKEERVTVSVGVAQKAAGMNEAGARQLGANVRRAGKTLALTSEFRNATRQEKDWMTEGWLRG